MSCAYPAGVTATVTDWSLSRSLRTEIFQVLVAFQPEAPPRTTKGRFLATYLMNSRGDGISDSSSAAGLFSSLYVVRSSTIGSVLVGSSMVSMTVLAVLENFGLDFCNSFAHYPISEID